MYIGPWSNQKDEIATEGSRGSHPGSSARDNNPKQANIKSLLRGLEADFSGLRPPENPISLVLQF